MANPNDFTIDKILKRLEQHYPDTLPMKPMTDFEHGQKVGRRDVIQFIQNLIKDETS